MLGKFLELTPQERGWCLVLVPTLTLVQLSLVLAPLSIVMRGARLRIGESARNPIIDESSAARLGSLTTRVAGRLPFRVTCLAQAISAMLLLGRARTAATLSIGTRFEDTTFRAHAWLSIDGHIIVGDSREPFTPITTLVDARSTA